MNVVVLPTREAACLRAAEIVAALLAAKPDAALALPAGNTPRPVYDELARRHREQGLSFAGATTFALDEYAGMGRDHQASFARFLDEELYRRVDLPAARAHAPDATAADLGAACERYERAIEAAGGLDLCLLGIGGNGHVAFNEPGSTLAQGAHEIELAQETRAGAEREFGVGRAPRRGITLGLREIHASKRIVILVTGAGKAEILHALLHEPPSSARPASLLLAHPDLTLLADRAAAGR
jgi:glucosamine-6-phosphate deaminase